MLPDARIRPYQGKDFAAVCELDTLCFPPRIAYTPEEIDYFLSRRGAICLVADTPGSVVMGTPEGGVVAWILGQAQLSKTANPGAGHIITIDVHPHFRRRRIGESLMDTLESEFQQRGCTRIRLEVATDNLGAQAFYQRRGYKALRTLRHYYADGSDALRMERAL